MEPINTCDEAFDKAVRIIIEYVESHKEPLWDPMIQEVEAAKKELTGFMCVNAFCPHPLSDAFDLALKAIQNAMLQGQSLVDFAKSIREIQQQNN